MSPSSSGIMNHAFSLINVQPRTGFLLNYLKGKAVLHVGCADVPVFDPETNLHIKLSKEIEELHGLDVDVEGIDVLRKYVDKKYYTSVDQIDRSYDIVLAPEVLEHVLNAGLFLKDLMEIDAPEIMIMAPNAIDILKNNLDIFGWKKLPRGIFYQETTHKDHKSYYSPVTMGCLISSAIEEYAPEKWVLGPLFLCELSVACVIRRVGSAQSDAELAQKIKNCIEHSKA